jgi:peroxiredoxin
VGTSSALDPAPFFRAPTSKGQTIDSDAYTGKLAVALCFVPDPAESAGQLTIASLDELLAEFGRLRVQLLGVVPLPARAARELGDGSQLAVTLLADEDGSIAAAYGMSGERGAVLVDRTGRVVSRIDTQGAALGAPVLDEARRLHDEDHELVEPTV